MVKKLDCFKGHSTQSSSAVTQTTSKESDITTGEHMGSCHAFPIPLLSFIYSVAGDLTMKILSTKNLFLSRILQNCEIFTSSKIFNYMVHVLCCIHFLDTGRLKNICIMIRVLSGPKILRGKRWTNGPPWWSKGVGVGGGCVPSCAKRGKLKHNFISVFSKSHLSNTSGDL